MKNGMATRAKLSTEVKAFWAMVCSGTPEAKSTSSAPHTAMATAMCTPIVKSTSIKRMTATIRVIGYSISIASAKTVRRVRPRQSAPR